MAKTSFAAPGPKNQAASRQQAALVEKDGAMYENERNQMFEKIRDKMRELIRSLDYVMTIHGEEEMENDGLSILDVESAILTGEITEHQRDVNTAESKYLVTGKTLDDIEVTVVAKLGLKGKLVIITVYEEKDEYEN